VLSSTPNVDRGVSQLYNRSQHGHRGENVQDSPVHGHRRPNDARSTRGGYTPEQIAVMILQRSAGNRAVTRLIELQRAESGPAPEPTRVPEVLRSSGRSLESSVRARMEESLGADFSRVRLHTDTVAQRSALEIGARAYTSGQHVVLGAGASDPHTLAHELWHVRQQSRGPVAGTDAGNGLSISDPHDRFEREAEVMADRAVGGCRPMAPLDRPLATGVAHDTGSGLPVQRAPFFGSSETADVAALADAGRRKRLERDYGPLVGPHRVKPESELADDENVRLNPVWYRLEDFPPALLLDRGRQAVWCFSVGARGEILMGTEMIDTVVEDAEWTRLFNGMHEKNPTLTMEDLRMRLNASGHPTIAAGFESLGRTKTQPARFSGELLWSGPAEGEQGLGQFVINDKSGRYMGPKVRPGLRTEDSLRWMDNVARRMSRHFGVAIGLAETKHGA
jgi:hypothetical protein